MRLYVPSRCTLCSTCSEELARWARGHQPDCFIRQIQLLVRPFCRRIPAADVLPEQRQLAALVRNPVQPVHTCTLGNPEGHMQAEAVAAVLARRLVPEPPRNVHDITGPQHAVPDD